MKSFKKAISSLLLVPAIALSLGLFAPTVANAQACNEAASGGLAAGAECSKGAGTANSLFGGEGIFTLIVNILLYIIGAIAVIMLIIGGIRYVTSGGNATAVTAAKNTILYAIVGIIIALLAYAIVNFVLTSFAPATT